MKQAWRIKGHDKDNEKVNDVDENSMGLETSLDTAKDKRSLVGKQDVMNAGRQDTGLQNAPTRKRKDKQKRLAL